MENIKNTNNIMTILVTLIQGWDISGRTNKDFYQPVTIDKVKYTLRDILWPIPESELRVNRNLVQNPGW